MSELDYYETLGVHRDATDEDIKKAYRKLVFQYHPDRNPDNQEAETKIREINAAYAVLGDPETRKSFERLTRGVYPEPSEPPPDPETVLQAMEDKLAEEGRKEIFALLIKNVPRIKSELAVIRERVVADQGYDSFQEDVVRQRAAEIMGEFASEEMDVRRERILDVAVKMMVSQKVIKKGDEERAREVKERFRQGFDRGREHGFRDALALFYVRR